jgi:primosomal replication protein N
MNLNSVQLAGVVKVAPSLTYSREGVPTLHLLLSIEEETRSGKTFTLGIPVAVVGDRAESLAERLEAGDVVIVSGKLQHRTRADRTGSLGVYGVHVQRLRPVAADTAA